MPLGELRTNEDDLMEYQIISVMTNDECGKKEIENVNEVSMIGDDNRLKRINSSVILVVSSILLQTNI